MKDRVLALVAEKTGYPIDMLDLDLDLEADLGVDTVKQAEVFATIREAYGIARDDQIKLRDYPTLAHVIRFVNERRPDAAVAAPPVVAPTGQPETTKLTAPLPGTISAPTSADDAVKERILALAVEKTGYPQDMLDLDLDLEADLGVDTVKQAEMFAAIREIYNIPRDENRKLRDYPTLAHVIRFVYEKRPDLASAVASAPNRCRRSSRRPSRTPEPAVSRTATAHRPGDSVKERILALVVEKTGYPQDMLDLDLDLEADLGVDTVKQAEMFAAIREIYNIPRDENRKLRDYPTLSHVIRFVYENRPDLASAVASAPPPQVASRQPSRLRLHCQPPSTAPASDSVKERILALVVEKTGYPQDMLDLDLDLEADLGVDTVKQAEMFAAIREIYNIPRDENRKLRDYPTLSHVIRFVYENRPDLAGTVAPSPTTDQPGTSAAAPAPSRDRYGRLDPEKVLEIAAEKTGYPQDMLDLDLDLEADLGVDTVKQAEMFAAIRAAYNIPRDENLKLRDFPTLAHVIQFARERSTLRPLSLQADEPPSEACPQLPRRASHGARREPASFDAANSIPRRVPVPVLRPPLTSASQRASPLSVAAASSSCPTKAALPMRSHKLLQAQGVEVLRIEGTPDADALTSLLKSWLAAGPVQGVYWLPALDDEGDIAQHGSGHLARGCCACASSRSTPRCVLCTSTSRAPGTFLVSATRLGGQHGYDDAGALAPLGGAVVGFTKTYQARAPGRPRQSS